jgi:hypothetical protein
MVRTALRHALPKAAARIPGLRRLPVLNLLAIGELALLARRHVQDLDPDERRRLAALVRRGPRLSPAARADLRRLVGKLDLRGLAGSAVERLSPIPLPRRLTGARS